jgi:outer membrane lipoprotein-sorting protein
MICALALSTCSAADWKLPDLMQLLSQQKTGKASFVEKKYIAMLDKPVESSGELSFTAPDRLEKRTIKPRLESLVLDGDRLSVEQAGKRSFTVSLQEHPEIASFVESIRATLAGDRQALERYYALDLTGSAEKWQLMLTPTQASMAKIVQRVRIQGAQTNLKTIEFEQADGDRSEMVINKIGPP